MESWQLTLIVGGGLVILSQYLRARRGMPEPYDSDQPEPITRLGLDRPTSTPKRPTAPRQDRIMADPPSASGARPPPPPPPPPPLPLQEQGESEDNRERDGVETPERQR